MSFISDVKVVDAIRFLEYFLDDNLINPGEVKKGCVEMSIIYFNERNLFSIGTACGILTLGIGTLCGIPYAKAITKVEIEARFYDEQAYLISEHR